MAAPSSARPPGAERRDTVGRKGGEDFPPIEVVGAEPSPGSMQRVSLGGRGAGTRSRWPIVLGVVVLLAALVSFLTGDDAPVAVPADETTTTAPATTTTTARPTTTTAPTTTTTTLPTGPVFPEPTGAELLVYGSALWTLVDLDTGERRPVPGLKYDQLAGIAVANGYVIIDPSDSRARYFPRAALLDDRIEPIDLGDGDQALPSPGHPDQVWIIDGEGAYEGGLAGDITMRLVALSGRELRRIALPAGVYPEGAYDAGIVVQMGGRVFVLDEDGATAIASARLVGTARDVVLLHSCDDTARCQYEIRNLTASTSAVVDLPDMLAQEGIQMAAAPDGRVSITAYGNEGGDVHLRLYDRAGALLAEPDVPLLSGLPIWLPRGLGVILQNGNQSLGWFHSVAGGSLTYEALPGLDGLPVELAFLIEP